MSQRKRQILSLVILWLVVFFYFGFQSERIQAAAVLLAADNVDTHELGAYHKIASACRETQKKQWTPGGNNLCRYAFASIQRENAVFAIRVLIFVSFVLLLKFILKASIKKHKKQFLLLLVSFGLCFVFFSLLHADLDYTKDQMKQANIPIEKNAFYKDIALSCGQTPEETLEIDEYLICTYSLTLSSLDKALFIINLILLTLLLLTFNVVSKKRFINTE